MGRFAFLLVASFAFSSAFAVPVFEKGKWVLDDSNPESATEGVCAASTAANLGAVPYVFSVIVDKAGLRPIEVTVRPYTSPSESTAMVFNYSSREAYNFAKLPTLETGEDILWHVPRNTKKLVDYLKAQSEIRLESVAGVQGRVKFSLSGSSATLAQLERRCASQSLYEAKEFEELFLAPENLNFDVTRLSPEGASMLREAILRGVAAFKDVKTAQAQIADLESRFARLTREARDLNNQLAALRADRAEQQAARETAQAAIDTANAEIAEFQRLIGESGARLAQAQANLDAANAAIAPHKPEHDRLRGLVRNDEARVSRAQQAVDAVNSRIRAATELLARLDGEREQLRRSVDDIQRELRSAQLDLDDAERAFRNFDVQEEARRERENNWELRNLEQEIRNLRQQADAQEPVVQARRQERNQKRQALDQCVSAGNPDCSAEQAALNQAEQNLAQAQQVLQNLRGEIQNRQQRRQWINDQIERNVIARRDQLANQVERQRQRVREIENRRRETEDRLSNIVRFDIPNAQADLAGQRAALPDAEREVSSAQSALSRSRETLRAYDESVNYAALQQAVTDSTRAIAAIREEVSDWNDGIGQRQSLIRRRTATRDQADQKIARLDQQILPKQTRLDEVNALLAPYQQEKSDIDQRLAEANQRLSQAKTDYGAQVPR